MARRAALAALVVIAAGTLGLLIPFLAHKREATALTPAVPPLAPGSLIPAGIDPGHQLCIHDLPFAPDGQIARVLTATGGKPGQPLLVTATGPGYRARTPVRAGWHDGPLEIPIMPPRTSLHGTLCFRNTGTRQVALMASGVGQKLARPVAYLDQQPLGQDVPLVFHRAKRATTFNRAGAIIGHTAALSLLPAWLLWVLGAAGLVRARAAAGVARLDSGRRGADRPARRRDPRADAERGRTDARSGRCRRCGAAD